MLDPEQPSAPHHRSTRPGGAVEGHAGAEDSTGQATQSALRPATRYGVLRALPRAAASLAQAGPQRALVRAEQPPSPSGAGRQGPAARLRRSVLVCATLPGVARPHLELEAARRRTGDRRADDVASARGLATPRSPRSERSTGPDARSRPPVSGVSEGNPSGRSAVDRRRMNRHASAAVDDETCGQGSAGAPVSVSVASPRVSARVSPAASMTPGGSWHEHPPGSITQTGFRTAMAATDEGMVSRAVGIRAVIHHGLRPSYGAIPSSCGSRGSLASFAAESGWRAKSTATVASVGGRDLGEVAWLAVRCGIVKRSMRA
jgi:hypothetical protein